MHYVVWGTAMNRALMCTDLLLRLIHVVEKVAVLPTFLEFPALAIFYQRGRKRAISYILSNFNKFKQVFLQSNSYTLDSDAYDGLIR